MCVSVIMCLPVWVHWCVWFCGYACVYEKYVTYVCEHMHVSLILCFCMYVCDHVCMSVHVWKFSSVFLLPMFVCFYLYGYMCILHKSVSVSMCVCVCVCVVLYVSVYVFSCASLGLCIFGHMSVTILMCVLVSVCTSGQGNFSNSYTFRSSHFETSPASQWGCSTS